MICTGLSGYGLVCASASATVATSNQASIYKSQFPFISLSNHLYARARKRNARATRVVPPFGGKADNDRVAPTASLLQCMSPLLALSGHPEGSGALSAFGGKADI